MALSLFPSVVSAPARRLELVDLAWATALAAEASAGYPALEYVSTGAAQQQWLLRQLLELVLRHGGAYTNAAGTALVLWLGPQRRAADWHLWLRLLPAAAWHLDWASSQRLRRLLRTAAWLRQHSLPDPHHLLLAVAVHPAARGQGEGRRLLAATLALRQEPALPCYYSAHDPGQLAFYQRQGFALAGHCAVADGPAGLLGNWGLVRPAGAAG